MKRQSIVNYGKPLQETVVPAPEPRGGEVLGEGLGDAMESLSDRMSRRANDLANLGVGKLLPNRQTDDLLVHRA